MVCNTYSWWETHFIHKKVPGKIKPELLGESRAVIDHNSSYLAALRGWLSFWSKTETGSQPVCKTHSWWEICSTNNRDHRRESLSLSEESRVVFYQVPGGLFPLSFISRAILLIYFHYVPIGLKIDNYLERNGSGELPGLFNPLVVVELFHEQSQSWDQNARACFKKARSTLTKFRLDTYSIISWSTTEVQSYRVCSIDK